MNIYIKASVFTLITGILFGGLFFYWQKQTISGPSAGRIGQLEELESVGAYDFEFTSLKSERLRLSSLKGKIIVLNFWASWCGPCVEEIPSMMDLVSKMNGDLILVAISMDSDKNEMESFLKSFPGITQENIYVAWDDSKAIRQLYNVERLPESYIIAPNFKLTRKIIGEIKWNSDDALEFMRKIQ